MHPPLANGNESRISLWLRVREFAVPPVMIETATARRAAGDWIGACAAAGFEVDVDLPALTRSHGREFADRVRADLRHLAPDLLRWHLPRIAPEGLLRPGLTATLARYDPGGSDCAAVHLVARTAPARADAGQRIALALWDESDRETGHSPYPHPRPDRRFRLDLHRHLWDARRTGELRIRSGAAEFDAPGGSIPHGCAVGRWSAEAAILRRAEGRPAGPVLIRLGARRRMIVESSEHGTDPPRLRTTAEYPSGRISALPILPDAATWILPDLQLLRAGAITADRLHPLVAAALGFDLPPPETPCRTAGSEPYPVECRGQRHRIGLVNGTLSALDHSPAEIRREELLVALSGTPLPCLQAIDLAHRRPDCLADVRDRLDHGDIAGALAVVEGLLGTAARLRDGPLRDELDHAARRRDIYEQFRSGLPEPGPSVPRRRPEHRTHPRQAMAR
ncbi:hypothetical protein [Nocardia sp. BMG111209]|uniref:hypothetical protein n=1 Tax=Nocardia sp. BMG111209 TaxID=1160137 RepID=UPI0003A5F1B5|nr:hypothetical protein [Nocardia sp. BMG111209]